MEEYLTIDIYDSIGIVGVVFLLVSYILFQSSKLNIYYFSFFNVIGSSLIIINLLYKWNLSSFLIEFGWLIISIYGVFKHFKNK